MWEIVSVEPRIEDSPIVVQLREAIQGYLDEHRRVSLNGLSKRCQTSEPTLRRIMSGKVKTAPTLTTVVDILSTISKESSLPKLIELYPGPIAESLKENFGLVLTPECNYQSSETLNKELADEQKYLIFKLAANSCGVKRNTIKELFGLVGEEKCDELISKDLLTETVVNQERVIKTKVEGFSLSHRLFVKNFKAVANYIDASPKLGKQDNLFYNLSESLSDQGLKEVLNIQRQALQKIIKVLNDPKYSGEHPVFVLSAIDTMEKKRPENEDLLQ